MRRAPGAAAGLRACVWGTALRSPPSEVSGMAILTTRRVLSIVAISVTLVSQATWAADVEVQLGAGDGFVIQDNTATIERPTGSRTS